MDWLKDHVKEIVLSIGSALGLWVIGYISTFTALYCVNLLNISPIVCYEDRNIRFALYFIIASMLSAIIVVTYKSTNIPMLLVSAVVFLIVIFMGRFISKEATTTFLQSAYVIPLQVLSGLFLGSLGGGLVRFIWSRFGTSIVRAIERRLGKVGTP
jgi:glucose-6-phosphate-specific signal transduction histidine kinase